MIWIYTIIIWGGWKDKSRKPKMPGFEWIGKEEKEAVAAIFDQGGVLFAHGFDDLRGGVYHVREFEAACSEYFGVNHCVAVSSGTAAVKVALKAVGVRPGDEVIPPAFNFIAVVEAILDTGAKPIIANVNRTLNMDAEETQSLITPRTRALLPVHMLGVPADMHVFRELAKKNSLDLILFLLADVGGIPELNLPDRIHPNVEGHQIVAETVWETLRPILEHLMQ